MTKASDNEFPSLLIKEGTAPSSPGAGDQRLFVDSSDHLLKYKNSSGTVSPVATGLTDPMTTRGDIIIRNASNVSARLAVGAAGKFLSSDGTDVSWGNGPMTAKGDLIVGDTSGAPVRKAVGSNGQVLTADAASTGGVKWAAGGGGGGSWPPLDQYALDGTYGDHFTGASLSGSWTRRNYTSGAESYQQGYNGTYLRISTAGRSNGDGYFQSSSTDGTYACKIITRFYGDSVPNFGVAMVDSSGSGVVISQYTNPRSVIVLGVTTYSSYSGSSSAVGGGGARIIPAISQLGEVPLWLYLRKSGTSVYGAYSLDGEIWSPESSAFTWSGTMNRVGLLHAPLASATGDTVTAYIDIDWFNKIA